MNDYWNNPPDEPEPPNWYQELELAMEDETMPQTVKDGIWKLLDDWTQEWNKAQDIEPFYDLFDENDL
jgi:hypothetical protein